MSSSFGTLFRVTTFGESHGPAVGAVIDFGGTRRIDSAGLGAMMLMELVTDPETKTPAANETLAVTNAAFTSAV